MHHLLCWRGSVQGCDGSGGVPQGDTRTQPRLPVTMSEYSITAAAGDLWADTAAAAVFVGVTRATCTFLNKHFRSFLTCLYSTCITIMIVSRRFSESPSLTPNKRWRLRTKSSGGDKAGPTDKKRRRHYVTVVVWKPGDGDRPTGSEVIAAVARTRFLFLNILFYWKRLYWPTLA